MPNLKKLFHLTIIGASTLFAMESSNVSSGKEEESAPGISTTSEQFTLFSDLPAEMRVKVMGFIDDWKLKSHTIPAIINSYKRFNELSRVNKEFRSELSKIYKKYLLENLTESDLKNIKSAIINALNKRSVSNDTYLLIKLLSNLEIINKAPEGETSLLMYASSACNPDVAKFLIDSGADINAQNAKGVTSLMYASAHNCIAIVKLLINKKANLNIRDVDGWTALKYATFKEPYVSPNISELLRKAGAKE